MRPNGRVAIVAHDAGGAEILACYVAQNGICDVRFVLAGPAVSIFRQRLGGVSTVSLSAALHECDWLLTGSGWQTDFEWQAILQGRAAGKHVVTFLDHWGNYISRFARNGMTCFPDEIWVGDTHAEALALETFPDLVVHQIRNPYFNYFVSEVERLDSAAVFDAGRTNQKNVLFVCENINRDDFHQNDAIRYFMGNLGRLGVSIGRIVIRPHPSETADKYAWVAQEFDGNISLSKGASLAEEVATSDIVAGCTSMAMALAVMAHRRVISCIPSDKIRLTLPFEQIERLSSIIKQCE